MVAPANIDLHHESISVPRQRPASHGVALAKPPKLHCLSKLQEGERERERGSAHVIHGKGYSRKLSMAIDLSEPRCSLSSTKAPRVLSMAALASHALTHS